MKTTKTNEIQTTGDQPVANKPATPPGRLLWHLAMAALAGFATNAQADIIHVGGEIAIGDTTLTVADGIAMVPNTGANWAAPGWTGPPYIAYYTNLTSRTLTVPTAGDVTLRFQHRYNMENEWDGGAVYVSRNGAAPTYVPASAFSANGYNVVPNLGNSSIYAGMNVFNGESAGWSTSAHVESMANLGAFAMGDTLAITFRGGWDEGTNQGSPGWEIASVDVRDAADTALLNVSLLEGAGGFSVASDVGMPNPWTYAGVDLCRFELDADANTADRFVPSTPGVPINLNSATLDVVLLNGTLAPGDTFTLFDLSGGSTLEGRYGSLTLPPGTWDLSGLQPGGNGQITLLVSSTWIPTTAGTYEWDDPLNWTDGIPNVAGEIANLNLNLAGAQTINLNQVTTVGAINLGDAGSTYYGVTVVGNGGSLIMDGSSGSATIARTNSKGVKDRITADIALSDNLIVSDANGWENDGQPYYLELSGAISGEGRSVTASGSGAVALTGANTYTGGTTVSSGWFHMTTDSIGTGPLTINGGEINMSSYAPLANGNAIIVNGDFKSHYGFHSGTGPITLSTAGITVAGSVTLGGVITGPGGLNAFDLTYAVPNGIGTGGEFKAPITLRGNQVATINGWGPMWSVLTVSGAIGDGGNGYGVAVNSASGAAKLYLTAANTYSGDTTINPGAHLSVGIGDNLALQNSALVLTAQKVAWCGAGVTRPTIGGLKGSTDLALAFADNPTAWTAGNYDKVTALTLNPQSGTCTYSGAIANGMAGMTLTKTGAGTQVLAGNNTYTGATQVNVGTLILDGTNTGSGAVTVANNARLGGNGSTTSAVTIDSGGKLLADITDWSAGTCSLLTVASLSLPATWTVEVNVSGFTEADQTVPFLTATGGLGGVTAPSVTGPGTGTWLVRPNPADATTLELVYTVGGPSPYATWAARTFAKPFTDTDPAHDPDGDGLSNQQEFAFGLDPTTGSSANPVTVPLKQGTHQFTYTRYAASGLSYQVWTSVDLQTWNGPAALTEIVSTPDSKGVVTVQVTLTSPPAGGTLFVRVAAR
ncbi:MAG: autotransporter-associated beta strand repeat-containing protein [Verrucomicrobia bacterium]|nr:autotransporter-associated beta strand repeat-containing protein [Verrucomicrobiota bacterium]